MLSSTRQHAIVKLVVLAVIFWAFVGLVWGLSRNGYDPGKVRALPVVPMVLSLVPILEFLLDAPFSELSIRWNRLPPWKQWSIVLLVPAGGMFIMFVLGGLFA